MPTPLAKTSEVLVLDEINKKAHESLTFSDVIFGPPQINPDPSNGRNTMMAVSSRPGKYFGASVVWYNRLNLTTLFQMSGYDTIELVRPDPFTSTTQLLPEINATYGLALTPSDIVDQNPPETEEFDLFARTTSYAFTGKLHVRVVEPRIIPIDEVVYQGVLQALEYPTADLFGLILPEHDIGVLEGTLAIQDGHLRMNPNYDPGWFYTAYNGELRIGLAVRRQAGSIQAQTDFDGDGRYLLPMSSGEAGNIIVSMELLDRPGLPADVHSLTARYDISMFVRPKNSPSAQSVIFQLHRSGGLYEWRDLPGAPVPVAEQIAGPGSTSHLLHQVRMSLPTSHPMLPSFGEYEVGIVAHRKQSLVPRLYIACGYVVMSGV